MPIITSPHNDRVKLVRALQTSGRARRKEHKLVLEGVRLIGDALATGVQPDFALFTAEIAETPLIEKLQGDGIPCFEVTPEMLAHAADTQNPQGVIVVAPLPSLAVPAKVTLALILDAVADPGNLGAILRTAAAARVDVVVLAPACVDAFNPKVLRSAMGAHFRIPILRGTWADVIADYAGYPSYLADADSQTAHYQVDWTQPSVLVIGGEAHGADIQARTFAKTPIAIPMGNGVESLNAGAAAAVILFEVVRQRHG